MPNKKSNTHINASDPMTDGGSDVFSRTWFRFFGLLASKVAILDGTLSTSATSGTATGLPATPAGYMTIIDTTGVARKVPYYNE